MSRSPMESGIFMVTPRTPRDDCRAAIHCHPGRWRAPAMAAALAMRDRTELDVDGWVRLLDMIAEVLGLVVVDNGKPRLRARKSARSVAREGGAA